MISNNYHPSKNYLDVPKPYVADRNILVYDVVSRTGHSYRSAKPYYWITGAGVPRLYRNSWFTPNWTDICQSYRVALERFNSSSGMDRKICMFVIPKGEQYYLDDYGRVSSKSVYIGDLSPIYYDGVEPASWHDRSTPTIENTADEQKHADDIAAKVESTVNFKIKEFFKKMKNFRIDKKKLLTPLQS